MHRSDSWYGVCSFASLSILGGATLNSKDVAKGTGSDAFTTNQIVQVKPWDPANVVISTTFTIIIVVVVIVVMVIFVVVIPVVIAGCPAAFVRILRIPSGRSVQPVLIVVLHVAGVVVMVRVGSFVYRRSRRGRKDGIMIGARHGRAIACLCVFVCVCLWMDGTRKQTR